MDTQTQTPAVTVHETTLFDAYCTALESGEFVQIRDRMSDAANGRCVLGVANTVLERAGFARDAYGELHPRFFLIARQAADLLGLEYYGDIARASDGGETFTILAPALRRARIDVERGRT